MEKKNKIFNKTVYDKKSVQRMEKKIKKLGIKNDIDTITFMNLRLITTILVFVIILCITRFGYIIAPILSLVYYVLYEKFLLDDRLKRRTVKLESEAIYFFEVLTLSLETGRNLEEAIKVSMKNVDSEIGRAHV